jgi:hypothetical protein
MSLADDHVAFHDGAGHEFLADHDLRVEHIIVEDGLIVRELKEEGSVNYDGD